MMSYYELMMVSTNSFDGLAMGSPSAPHLANALMSRFDNSIKGNSKLYHGYMDDIILEKKQTDTEIKLIEINELHPSLTLTIEREQNNEIYEDRSTHELPCTGSN